jgi:hypothetical protein
MFKLSELNKEQLMVLVLYTMDINAFTLVVDCDEQTGIVSVFDRKNRHEILKYDRTEIKDESWIENADPDQMDLSVLEREELEQIVQGFIRFYHQGVAIFQALPID